MEKDSALLVEPDQKENAISTAWPLHEALPEIHDLVQRDDRPKPHLGREKEGVRGEMFGGMLGGVLGSMLGDRGAGLQKVRTLSSEQMLNCWTNDVGSNRQAIKGFLTKRRLRGRKLSMESLSEWCVHLHLPGCPSGPNAPPPPPPTRSCFPPDI